MAKCKVLTGLAVKGLKKKHEKDTYTHKSNPKTTHPSSPADYQPVNMIRYVDDKAVVAS